MRVLLVSANRLKAPYPVYPLGLDCVAASVCDRHQLRILDLLAEGEEMLEQVVAEFAPDAVGISLRNIDNTDATRPISFVEEYRALVARIRKATSAPVILGGCGFTIFAKPLMRLLQADYGIVGEGEPFVDLLHQLEQGLAPAGIPGLLARGSDGAPLPEPWASSPQQTGDVESKFSTMTGVVDTAFYLANGGMLGFQTKRGCPYRCSYCTYPQVEGSRLKLFPPEEVARTARSLEKAGARYLFATDATFNCSIEHNLAVADALRVVGLSIPWGAFFAPIRTTAEYYARLAASGLTHVEFGTESLSGPVLRSYCKPFCVDDVFREHEKALSAGLHVAHYFMLGGPDETPVTLEETLSNVRRLARTVSFFFCGVRIYPGTALQRRAVAEGQLDEADELLRPTYYRSPALAGIDVEQVVRRFADGRANWIIGAGGEQTMRMLERMYARGYAGPLWEKLVR